jgi:hypothetical protein
MHQPAKHHEHVHVEQRQQRQQLARGEGPPAQRGVWPGGEERVLLGSVIRRSEGEQEDQ